MNPLLLLFLLPVHSGAAVADRQFEHLSIEQGLSYSRVHCFLQDSQGFLWIGTEIGLNMYDGLRCTVYKHDFRDSTSLIQNSAIDMLEDRQHTLWVRTYAQGVERFDRTTGTFSHLLRDHDVLTMHEDTGGTLWLGTNGGLYRYDGGRFIRAAPENPVSCDTVTSICDSRTGEFLWVGTRSHVMQFDKRTGTFTPYETPFRRVRQLYEDAHGTLWVGTSMGAFVKKKGSRTFTRVGENNARPERNRITKIYEDREGRIWLGTADGLADSTGNRFFRNTRSQSDNPQEVRAILEDSKGVLWVGLYGGGLGLYEPSGDTVLFITGNSQRPGGLNDNIINAIFEDRTGTLWFGTVDAGAYKLDRARKPFTGYHMTDDPRDRITVSAIVEGRGVLWVGTSTGLCRYEKATGSVTWFRHDPEDPGSLSADYVWTLLIDRNGALWVGTWDGGLNRLPPGERKRFRHFRHNPSDSTSLSDDHVWYLLQDRSGTLWVSTYTAISRYDPVHNDFVRCGDGAYCMCEDSSGMLWMGSGGLRSLDPSTGTLQTWTHDPDDPRSLTDDGVSAILEDHGALWIGTFGGGLNRFDRNTGRFSAWTTKDGLPDDYIAGILGDSRGNLWLSTAKGIARFDTHTYEVRKFDRSDGVSIVQGWGQAHFKSAAGEMYIGGLYGLVGFQPDSIHVNPYVPPVVLTSFSTFDQPVALDSASTERRSITLPYSRNVLTFDFVALNFTSAEKNQYAYKLEGFDSAWTYCGTRRTAHYTNLDGGRYLFRVKGSNNDGVWNEQGASLAIIIRPPFWKTWWFAALMVLSFMATTVVTIRAIEKQRSRRRIDQMAHAQELDRERLRISRDMHDEVGATLTQISILSELARTGSAPGDHIQKISEKSREVIDSISEIIWAINPNNDNLENLVSYLRQYTMEYFEASSIACDFFAPDDLPALSIPAQARRNTFLVCKEGMHNVMKHSRATEFTFTLQQLPDRLEISLTDNGAGFVPGPATGNGLTNMQRRMEEIGGSFRVNSRPGAGTILVLTLPSNGT
jgi:ligand-binding sensor domain-containing protein/signal transduction histidine kinase